MGLVDFSKPEKQGYPVIFPFKGSMSKVMFLQARESITFKESKITHLESTKHLTVAHEAKPNGLLTHGP